MFDWSTLTRPEPPRRSRYQAFRIRKPRDYSAAAVLAGAALIGGLWLLVIVGLACVIGVTSAISAGVGALEQGRRRGAEGGRLAANGRGPDWHLPDGLRVFELVGRVRPGLRIGEVRGDGHQLLPDERRLLQQLGGRRAAERPCG